MYIYAYEFNKLHMALEKNFQIFMFNGNMLIILCGKINIIYFLRILSITINKAIAFLWHASRIIIDLYLDCLVAIYLILFIFSHRRNPF